MAFRSSNASSPMPGESIYLNHGKVYVNGKLLDEPYISKYNPTFAYEKKRK